MVVKPSKKIFKNKMIGIDAEFKTNRRSIKSQIYPDICYWPDEVGEHIPV
jgi:hypothetical protein